MKDMFTVLKYTIKENITKKAFIIATAILMAIIIIHKVSLFTHKIKLIQTLTMVKFLLILKLWG